MNLRARRNGVSLPVYLLMLVLAVVAFLLDDATNGRSWGLIAVIGVVAIIDYLVYVRRPSVNAHPVSHIVTMVGGVGFIVMGVLAATGTIEINPHY